MLKLLTKSNNKKKIVNLKEYEQKLKKEIEIETEYKTLPHLIGESNILKEENLRKVTTNSDSWFFFFCPSVFFLFFTKVFYLLQKLNVNLIPRAVGYNWVLTFGTEQHGFSLNTMYRLLADVDSPCLVVVMDTNRNVIGSTRKYIYLFYTVPRYYALRSPEFGWNSAVIVWNAAILSSVIPWGYFFVVANFRHFLRFLAIFESF
jgi:hypothetical protein